MSERDGAQSSTKQRRSRKTSTANQQNVKQALAAQRPANDDTEGWKAYWKAQGHEWRTEPEIDTERQKYLSERRCITPDIQQGIYPFKDIEPKLTRADVEWLLASHETGRGPIDWGDESQHKRLGLDLRGADLRHINLIGLPLAGIYGGLHRDQWLYSSAEQCEAAALQLERADLRSANLEGADLHYAHLERADLRSAHLERTDLTKAHLQSADLNSTHFEEANLSAAQLQGAYLGSARLEQAHLKDVHLEGADLYKAHLEGAILCGAFFDSATIISPRNWTGK